MVSPQSNCQHGLQQLFDVLLDGRAHSPGQHADAGEHRGIHLHSLLSPAQFIKRKGSLGTGRL